MEQGFSATQPERVHVISFVLGVRWCDGLAESLESSRSNILEKSICRRNKKMDGNFNDRRSPEMCFSKDI